MSIKRQRVWLRDTYRPLATLHGTWSSLEREICESFGVKLKVKGQNRAQTLTHHPSSSCSFANIYKFTTATLEQARRCAYHRYAFLILATVSISNEVRSNAKAHQRRNFIHYNFMWTWDRRPFDNGCFLLIKASFFQLSTPRGKWARGLRQLLIPKTFPMRGKLHRLGEIHYDPSQYII